MTQKFFELVPKNTRVNFIGVAPYFFMASGLFLLLSMLFLGVRGLNYGVDFRGGTELYVRFASKPAAADVRAVLKPIGFSQAVVQGLDEKGSGDYLVRVPPEELNLRTHQDRFQKAFDGVTEGNKARLRFSEERIYAVYDQAVEPPKIKGALEELKIQDLEVESVELFGRSSANEYLIQFAGVGSRLIKAFRTHFGGENFEVLRVEEVGEKVGSELRWQAIGAVLISIVLILIYVWFRFDREHAPGAIVALVHDAVGVLGIFSLLRLQFDLTTVAAVLTIVGFSINDTIVIYDRIRENLKVLKNTPFPELINQSINETLSRTLLTSGTFLMASLALLFLGGPITRNFAMALSLGVVLGTYSTIYVASPLTIYVYRYLEKRRAGR